LICLLRGLIAENLNGPKAFTLTALVLWSGADFKTQNLKICTEDC
jgi:hypothetical protein